MDGVLCWYHRCVRNIFAHQPFTVQRIFLKLYPPQLRIFFDNGRLSRTADTVGCRQKGVTSAGP